MRTKHDIKKIEKMREQSGKLENLFESRKENNKKNKRIAHNLNN